MQSNTWQIKIKGNVSVTVPADLNCLTTYVLLEQEDWFEDEMHLVRRIAKPGMNCLDIGACYGVYALTMAQAVGPEGKVYAFEPGEIGQTYLAKNKANNLTVISQALSHQPGLATLTNNPAEYRKLTYGTSVKLDTLNNWWEKAGQPKINLVKIDAGNSGKQIVQGGREFFQQNSPLVIFAAGKADEQITVFKELGYDIYRYLPGLDQLTSYAPETNCPFCINLIAAKKSFVEEHNLLSTQFPKSNGNWQDFFSTLPWSSGILPRWSQNKDSMYLKALNQLCALLPEKALSTLYELEPQSEPFNSVALSIARALYLMGHRKSASEKLLKPLGAVLENQKIIFSHPFLPPLPQQDGIPIKSNLENWVKARCIESFLKMSSFSGYSSFNQYSHILKVLHDNSEREIESERRLALGVLRSGTLIKISPESRLLSNQHLNADVWKIISSRVTAQHNRVTEKNASPQIIRPRKTHLPVSNKQLRNLNILNPLTIILDDGHAVHFQYFSKTSNSMIGQSHNGDVFIKIELVKFAYKRNELKIESEIVNDLNQKGCISCPKLLGAGDIETSSLSEIVEMGNLPSEMPYMALQFVKTQNSIPITDLLFTIQEQRKLGIFHADLKPDNIRFCPDTQVCYLIDYDQAELLEREQMDMPFPDFLRWADQRVREKYAKFNFKGLFHYFPGITLEKDILPQLVNGKIDIGKTKLLKSAETTLNKSKIYHTINLPDIIAQGERTLDARLSLMENIKFSPGEKVLDIGCNSGLLCAYLARKGCEVRGFDLDPYVIRAARMLSNIRGDNIEFSCVDLDKTDDIGKHDTIMLFSVLHHTQQVERNAKLIADSCKRIIIECRLLESGAKPVDGKWIRTTTWKHGNIQELIQSLSEYFPGFEFINNYGQADRDRFVMEFAKKDVTSLYDVSMPVFKPEIEQMKNTRYAKRTTDQEVFQNINFIFGSDYRQLSNVSDKYSDKKILFSLYSHLESFHPPFLSKNQIFCGPRCKNKLNDDNSIYSLNTPAGKYDIRYVLDKIPIRQQPEIFIAFVDATSANMPTNLEKIACKKVLFFGDTQHLNKPIQRLREYTLNNHYDIYISENMKHHLHFFYEIMIERNFYFFPAFRARFEAESFFGIKDKSVSFVGQVGRFHPYRRKVLQKIINKKSDLNIIQRASQSQAAQIFAKSLININISLNSNLCMRFLEVIGAGGFLLTERLSNYTGYDLAFKENRDFVFYDNEQDLYEKINYYLKNPDKALEIAKNGFETYQKHWTIHKRRQMFFDLVMEDKVHPVLASFQDERFPSGQVEDEDFLNERIRLYEFIQEQHKFGPVDIFLSRGVPEKHRLDLLDLTRLNIKSENLATHVSRPKKQPRIYITSDEELLGLKLPPWFEKAGIDYLLVTREIDSTMPVKIDKCEHFLKKINFTVVNPDYPCSFYTGNTFEKTEVPEINTASQVKLDLGCGPRKQPGYIAVDKDKNWPGVDVEADLTKRIPYPDNSVDEIRAHHIIEHLPDQIHTMNEIWRVCKPGAKVDIVVPSTDGRGAFQDPTHLSFWNINSFKYYSVDHPQYLELCKSYGFKGQFKILKINQDCSAAKNVNVHAILKTIK